MASVKRLESKANPSFKALQALASSARERRQTGLAWLDGIHLCDAWLEHRGGEDITQVVVSDSALEHPQVQAILREVPDVALVLSDSLFAALSDLGPKVALAFVVRQPMPAQAASTGQDWVLLDRVQDPGNVGTIMRTAAAAGVHGVAATTGCAQIWSPKVLRAGMGAQFVLHTAEDIDLTWWDQVDGLQVAVTDVHGGVDLWDANLRRPTLWLFGHEGEGVRPQWTERAGVVRVRIAQQPGVESMNVSAAAAVCLFEQRRQRR